MSKRNFKLSLRYARALAGATNDKSELLPLSEALETLSSVFDENQDFKFIIQDPSVSLEKKKTLLSNLRTSLPATEEFYSFLNMLLERGRFPLITQISDCFKEEVSRLFDVEKVEVTSASELSDQEKKEIVAELTSKGKIEVDWLVDPSLIAGMIIKTAGAVVDSSVKGRLKTIKETLRV